MRGTGRHIAVALEGIVVTVRMRTAGGLRGVAADRSGPHGVGHLLSIAVRRPFTRLGVVTLRTWLLGAVALWALLVWGLAAAGMGRHLSALALEPGQFEGAPEIRMSHADRLAPLSRYAQINARPLFSDDRQAHPFVPPKQSGEIGPDAFDFTLTGVLITPHLKMATLQSTDGSESLRIRLGEASASHPRWRLAELGSRRAVFEGPGGRREMSLRVYDGESGQEITASAALAGNPAPAPSVATDVAAMPVANGLAPGFACDAEAPHVGSTATAAGQPGTACE